METNCIKKTNRHECKSVDPAISELLKIDAALNAGRDAYDALMWEAIKK